MELHILPKICLQNWGFVKYYFHAIG